MFKAVIEEDKQGRSQTHYYLTQGDSCVIYATPYKDGAKLPVDMVEKCLFKFSDSDYAEEFEKELELDGDKFVLRLTTEETAELSVDTHYYEVEYTLAGGAVQTPNQWKFDILDQIK
jgi:hypothetical protein